MNTYTPSFLKVAPPTGIEALERFKKQSKASALLRREENQRGYEAKSDSTTVRGRIRRWKRKQNSDDGALAALWNSPLAIIAFTNLLERQNVGKALKAFALNLKSNINHTSQASAATASLKFEEEFGSAAFANHVSETIAANIEANDNADLVLETNPEYLIPYAPNIQSLKDKFHNGLLTSEELLPQIAAATLDNRGIAEIEYLKEHDAYIIGAGSLNKIRTAFEKQGKSSLGSTAIMTFREVAETQKLEEAQPVLQITPPQIAYARAFPAPTI